MRDDQIYSNLLVRSVNHIFTRFLNDTDIEEIYETQSRNNDPWVAIELDGTIKGELIINLPKTTLNLITKKFINSTDKKTIDNNHSEVAGELANLITGTFVNQLQYAEHEIRLSPPEFNDDPISIKALYENINLSFASQFGGFDIDFYYIEEE